MFELILTGLGTLAALYTVWTAMRRVPQNDLFYI